MGFFCAEFSCGLFSCVHLSGHPSKGMEDLDLFEWSNITIKNEVLFSVSFSPLEVGDFFIGNAEFQKYVIHSVSPEVQNEVHGIVSIVEVLGFLFTSGHLNLCIPTYTFWLTLKNCHSHLPHPIHHLPFNIYYQNMGFMSFTQFFIMIFQISSSVGMCPFVKILFTHVFIITLFFKFYTV
jgi:hypothetical protein